MSIDFFRGNHKVWAELYNEGTHPAGNTDSAEISLEPKGHNRVVMGGNYFLGTLEIRSRAEFIRMYSINGTFEKPLLRVSIACEDDDAYLLYTGPFSPNLLYKLYPDGSISPEKRN